MTSLHICLFSGVEIAADGRILALRSRKAAALVGYLALQPRREQSRDRLASLLWEDRPEAQARANLRQTLLTLRKLVAGHQLMTEPRLDWIGLDDSVTTDCGIFSELAQQGQAEDLTAAVQLYRGDLMEGIRIRSEAFEAWLTAERHRFRLEALTAIHALLESGQPTSSDRQIQVAMKALLLDPAEETAHRALMRLYAASGRRAEAIRQYFRCRDMLWREFLARPEAETDMLYNAVLAKSDRTGRPRP